MASSGWQGQKNIYTYSSNVTFIGNVNIQSITRSGTSVTVTGQIKFGARGTSGYGVTYNYGVRTRPSGGTWQKILSNGSWIYNGSSNDKTVNFTRTLTVPITDTTTTLTIQYQACYNSDCSSTYWSVSPSWTIDVGTAVAPEDVTVAPDSATWNTITSTATVGNWDDLPSDKRIRLNVTTEPYTTASMNGRRTEDITTSPATATINNSSTAFAYGAVNILGCGLYHTGAYVSAGGAAYRYAGGTIYTPPAPGAIVYQQADTNDWQITYTGDPNNNNATYDTASLTRTVRYKIGTGSWVNIESSAVKAIDATTIATITIPAGQTATIEAWMEYHGQQSEVSATTITNGAAPVHLYGSVSGLSKEITHLYGSVGGRAVKITKLYASVGGSAKKIFEDT